MKKMMNVKSMMMMLATASMMVACSSHDMWNTGNDPKVPGETSTEIQRNIANAFDYSMTTKVAVDLNYNRGGALIEIYDADKESYEGAVNGATKIYSAFTGSNGSYKGTMVIPTALIGKKVYAFSTSIGVTHKVEAVVTKNGLVVNEPSTRAVSLGKQTLPENMKTIVENELPEGTNNLSHVGQETDINLKVQKDCKIDVTFIWGGAGTNYWTGFWDECKRGEEARKQVKGQNDWICNNFKCNLYYFTYTAGNIPTAAEIEANFINEDHLVFAGADQDTSTGMMGQTVRLTIDGSETIKAGTRIGWVVTHPNYELPFWWIYDGSDNEYSQFAAAFQYAPKEYTKYSDFAANYKMPYIYSINSLNPEGENQSVRFSYNNGGEKMIIYCMEDLSVTRGNFIWGENDGNENHDRDHVAKGVKAKFPYHVMDSDKDFNDMMFIVKADPIDAIIEDDIPELEEHERYGEDVREGTLLYEDLFPEQGDYDMNDVVIEYRLVKYFDKDNKIVRLGYEFTPVWDGATYTSAFAFMFDGTIDDPVQVFSNHKQNMGKTIAGEITEGVAGLAKDALSWDSFNPFITVANTGYEVHLTKKASSKNAKLDGLDEYQKKYINDSDFPFAMNIPVKNFDVVTEYIRIDQEYPRFAAWVTSKAAEANDWYAKKGE